MKSPDLESGHSVINTAMTENIVFDRYGEKPGWKTLSGLNVCSDADEFPATGSILHTRVTMTSPSVALAFGKVAIPF